MSCALCQSTLAGMEHRREVLDTAMEILSRMPTHYIESCFEVMEKYAERPSNHSRTVALSFHDGQSDSSGAAS